jgi:putative ABC transport system ATP-binding protein
MVLQAVNVSRSFGREQILRNICLELAPGESLAITGPSGSGKSTLLSLLGLLLEPTCGEVLFEGKTTRALSDDQRSRLRNRSFGFIFQNPQLIGSLSVLHNVLVPARLARKRGLEDEARRLLTTLGLSHRLEHLPHQLSIGQKRRVAVARALLLEPVVVFADEPTNDLDAERAGQLGELLYQLPSQGRALVLVTHDRGLVGRADHTVDLSGART